MSARCSITAQRLRASVLSYQLEFTSADVGHVHVVGGRAQFFHLLAGEDIDGDQVDLGVTVLASLGGGHVDDLARAVLDADEAVLPQGRALHREGERRTGIGAVEGVLMLWTIECQQLHMFFSRRMKIQKVGLQRASLLIVLENE